MLYKKIKDLWRSPKTKELKDIWFNRMVEWRNGAAVVRIDRPTRLDRARTLGYRAKQGVILARVKLLRGGRKRRGSLKAGRRSKTARAKKIVNVNYQNIAEVRANKNFKNCEIMNSYYVAKDGRYIFYEVILVDRDHPQVKKDKDLKNAACKKGKAYRGLTSSGRKHRGLRGNKGKGAEKLRPSRNAHFKRKELNQRKIGKL